MTFSVVLLKIGVCAQGVECVRQESSANTLYGCTFMGCFGKFGNNLEWKRHENSAHFQQECWKCALCPSSTSDHGNRASRYESEDVNREVQTQLFYYRAVFITHLRYIHFADDATVDLEIKQRRIGRNCQSRFWCGFCGEIVVLQKKGLEGANERFDHIEEHFQRGQRVESWNEMDGSGVKGKEQRGGNKNNASESKGKHTSTASPVAPSAQSDCDTALRVRHDLHKVDSRNTSCDTGVLHKSNKTEKVLESVVDEDD